MERTDKYHFASPFFYSDLKVNKMMIPNVTLSNVIDYQLKIDDMEKSIIYSDEKIEHSIFLFIGYTFMLGDFSKILIVYQKEEDFELWTNAFSVMLSEDDYYVLNISQQTENQSVEEIEERMKKARVVFVFIKLDHLWDIFPRKNRIRGLVPFVTSSDEVDIAIPGGLFYSTEMNRLGIAVKPLKEPFDLKNPYTVEWSCVVFDMHEFDFENRLNVAYVINGIFSLRNLFFMDKIFQREEPSCLHAVVSMAKPIIRTKYDYNFTDAYTMNAYIASDYHVIEVDGNFDREIMTVVVKTKASKKRTVAVISAPPATESSTKSQRNPQEIASIQKTRLFLDFSTLFFWKEKKGIVKKDTGNQNRCSLILIPDRTYISILEKLDENKIKKEWKKGYTTVFKTRIDSEWSIQRRLDALIRFFNNFYTQKFYLLVESNTFPSVAKKTKNVSILFTEERVHLLLPEDANLVIFTPLLATMSNIQIEKTRCNLFIPAMDFWLEHQMAYHALHKVCFPSEKIKKEILRIPHSLPIASPSFETLTSFEKMMIPIFYYDEDSNRYESLYDFMMMIRERVYFEICQKVSKAGDAAADLIDEAIDFRELRARFKFTTKPLFNHKVVLYKRKILEHEKNKNLRQAAMYRFRLREYLAKTKINDTPCHLVQGFSNQYYDTINKAREALTLGKESVQTVVNPSEYASVYSILNPERQVVLSTYEKQTPPSIPNPLNRTSLWKNHRNGVTSCKSTLSDVQTVAIPCDPCGLLFLNYEDFNFHIQKREHLIHQKIAEEEAKFLPPAPIFDNESRGYHTVCPTILNIGELWKTCVKKYKCIPCALEFHSATLLLKHYTKKFHISRIEGKKQMLRFCRLCNFESPQRAVEKETHEKSEMHQKELKRFTCCICLKLQFGFSSYSSHVKRCTREAKIASSSFVSFLNEKVDFYPTTCFICKKQYQTYKPFENHCSTKDHAENLSFFLKNSKKCEICKVVFYDTKSFDDHLDSASPCAQFQNNIQELSIDSLRIEEGSSSTVDTRPSIYSSTRSSIFSSTSSLQPDNEEEITQREDFVYRIYFNKTFIFITHLFGLYEETPEKYKKGDVITSAFTSLESKMTMEDISSYLTLTFIDRCLSKKNSYFYFSNDATSGLLYVDMHLTYGVVGYYGESVKPLLVQLFKEYGSKNNDVMEGFRFDYFPKDLVPLLREVCAEFNLHVYIRTIDISSIANEFLFLYIKAICVRL